MTSPYSPDDDVDLGEVARDDALVEALLAGQLSDDDAALDALSALVADVSRDLPEPGVLVPRRTTGDDAVVLPLRRRTGPRVAVAAVAALGVLSVGGVAAAAPGSPLRPVRDAVSSAVQEAVDAVTPARSAGPGPSSPSPTSVSPSPSASASASPVRTGAASPRPSATLPASAQARIAGVQVTALLDQAERALDRGRLSAARALLANAARLLPSVTPADARARLQTRHDGLRARLVAAAPSPERSPDARPSRSPSASPSTAADSPEPEVSRSPKARPSRSAKAVPPTPAARPDRSAQATASPAAERATEPGAPKARATRTPPGLAPGTAKDAAGR